MPGRRLVGGTFRSIATRIKPYAPTWTICARSSESLVPAIGGAKSAIRTFVLRNTGHIALRPLAAVTGALPVLLSGPAAEAVVAAVPGWDDLQAPWCGC